MLHGSPSSRRRKRPHPLRATLRGVQAARGPANNHGAVNEELKNNLLQGFDEAGHDAGAPRRGAPLLSTMIEDLARLPRPALDPAAGRPDAVATAELAPVLRALLLPTEAGGVNLRNLVSHGFLSAIDRRWLSLTLVLMHTLDKTSDLSMSCSNNKENAQTKVVSQDASRNSEEVDPKLSATPTIYPHRSTSSLTKHEPMRR